MNAEEHAKVLRMHKDLKGVAEERIATAIIEPAPSNLPEDGAGGADSGEDDGNKNDTPSQFPALPSRPDDGKYHGPTVWVNGPAVALDHIGPIVINEDGSCGRLTQWNTLSPLGKEHFKLLVGQQNKERLAAIERRKAGLEPLENDGTLGGLLNPDNDEEEAVVGAEDEEEEDEEEEDDDEEEEVDMAEADLD
jgi:hypothetical protein